MIILTSEEIIAILSFLGTMCGTLGGILTSAKLTNFRIAQLEKKVDKHNGFAERIPLIEERVKAHENRLNNIEGVEYI